MILWVKGKFNTNFDGGRKYHGKKCNNGNYGSRCRKHNNGDENSKNKIISTIRRTMSMVKRSTNGVGEDMMW